MQNDTETGAATIAEREELIRMLSEVSKKLYRRISAERFVVRAPDNTYLGFVRAFSQVSQAMNSCLRDSELEDLEKRLKALEQETNKPKLRGCGYEKT